MPWLICFPVACSYIIVARGANRNRHVASQDFDYLIAAGNVVREVPQRDDLQRLCGRWLFDD